MMKCVAATYGLPHFLSDLGGHGTALAVEFQQTPGEAHKWAGFFR